MKRTAQTFAVAIFVVAALVAQAQTCPTAQLTNPAPGSTLPGSTVTFSWCNASADYFLTVESVQGAHDIFNAVVRVNSVTLINLPTNGGKIFLTLWTQIQGQWQNPFNYTFTAAHTTTPPPPQPLPDDKLAPSSSNLSVSTSQPATTQVTMTPMNGFNGTVTFSCAGLPANIGCQFTPATLVGNGTPAVANLVVSESAVARNHAVRHGAAPALLAFWSLGAGVFGMAFTGVAPQRRRTRLLWLACLALLVAQLVACGGAASSQPATTPPATPQTVSVAVVASASGGTQPATTAKQQFQLQITVAP